MRMTSRQPTLEIFSWILVVLVSAAVPSRAVQSANERPDRSLRSGGGAQNADGTTPYSIPQNGVPQYLPCPHQPQTFETLSRSFATGRIPSASEMEGSWVLTGLWLHPDSKPDLNCSGIMRGSGFEWVLVAGSDYSVDINVVGTYHQQSQFRLEGENSLKFDIDFGGDASPTFQCRVTRQDTLICLGDTYDNGTEFRRMRVSCEPVTPTSAAVRVCMPVK